MMKLSDNTLSVLKNFSDINNNILIRKGHRIRTVSQNKTVLGQANIDDEFPVDVGIYELKKLLNAIGLFSDPDIYFTDTYLTIRSGPSTMRYVYANPDVLHIASDNEVEIEPFDTVHISSDVIRAVDKARRTLNLEQVSIEGDGEKLWIKALDASGVTRDEFAIELGTSDRKFRAVIQSENLNLIQQAYDVEIDRRGVTHWKGDSIEYWITLNSKHSEF